MARKGKSATSPAQIEVDEKQVQALNLRKAGATYLEIANELGYASASGAYEAVKSILKKTMSEPAKELRDLEVSRMDDMLAAIWVAVLAGDTDAIATALRISERRSRLLGLDVKETAKHEIEFKNLSFQALVKAKGKKDDQDES